MPALVESGSRDFARKHNRAFRHPGELDPLAGEMHVGFFEPDVGCTPGCFLGCFRELKVSRNSFFAVFVRQHTRTVRRSQDARSRGNHGCAKAFLSSRHFLQISHLLCGRKRTRQGAAGGAGVAGDEAPAMRIRVMVIGVCGH